MYGLIGKVRAVAGQRDTLVGVLSENGASMPGCLSYIVAEDLNDRDVLWITEAWESEESHRASLQLAEVKAAIAKGRPLIAGFEFQVKTRPVAGV